MREVRAVVLGVFVVLLVVLGINVWRRPAREFHRVRGYRVEIRKDDGGRRHIAFTVPMSALARLASFSSIDVGGNMNADFGDGRVTAKDILDAANESRPGQPGVITRGHSRIEVTAQGAALDIQVHDDWDKNVRIRLPRSLVESFSNDSRISPRDILKKLDELGPGDVVSVHDRDEEVIITAEGR
jgi:hypothetical protein